MQVQKYEPEKSKVLNIRAINAIDTGFIIFYHFTKSKVLTDGVMAYSVAGIGVASSGIIALVDVLAGVTVSLEQDAGQNIQSAGDSHT